MILKPFMLRRIKKDVENDLTDKVCMVYTILVCKLKFIDIEVSQCLPNYYGISRTTQSMIS